MGWFPAWRDYDSDRVWVFGQDLKLPMRFAGQIIYGLERCDDVFRENFNDDEVSPVVKWEIPIPTFYFSWYTAKVRCGANIPGQFAAYSCEFVCFNP